MFDRDTSAVGDYNAKLGEMLFSSTNTELTYSDLNKDLQFFCDVGFSDTGSVSGSNHTLYLYSAGGNPGERFTSIEIGQNRNCVGLNGNNIVIDGLRMMYTGGHAVNGVNKTGITVKNCIFEYVGGSRLNEISTYGNAVQIFGSADDCHIDSNWCYQIYDTGVTIQYSGSGAKTMKNCSMSGNLIEYCYWGIEYYNKSTEGSVVNIAIEDNFIRYTGYGWGGVEYRYNCYSQTLAEQSAAICSFGLPENTNNVSVCNNMLQYSHQSLIRMDNRGGENDKRLGNTYIQYEGNLLLVLHKGFDKDTSLNKTYLCGADGTESALFGALGDTKYKLAVKLKD